MQKLKINFMTKKAKTTEKKETVNITFPNGIRLEKAKSGCNVWHLPQAMTTEEFRAFLSEYRDNPRKAEKQALVEAEKQNFIQ